eukprot:CAMPEP_0119515270 /NCGR_PEP_ID=MMETSP1344-20130328/32821_1 /TAXON_ID=236787 /ORGANISM="Florenciella parvula, Strain CCMP2471" /LENGTH=58 /DNA_ID=CAMNT_0007552665 /DNA_START=133 /DNA_END=309 /DNA_ORIENTATION=+
MEHGGGGLKHEAHVLIAKAHLHEGVVHIIELLHVVDIIRLKAATLSQIPVLVRRGEAE